MRGISPCLLLVSCLLLPSISESGLSWSLKQEDSSVRGGILADEMVMGKTTQAISLVLTARSLGYRWQVQGMRNTTYKEENLIGYLSDLRIQYEAFLLFKRDMCIYCGELPKTSEGTFSSMTVVLSSVVFFNIHELLTSKPTIYFQCQAENKIILLDVREKHFIYKFKGVESWQPLAELPDKKCKRCGFYELNREKSDDVFDEWDLCPDKFLAGNYVHYKEKEFNASFTCTECAATVGSASTNRKSSSVDKKLNLALAIFLGVLTSFVTSVATFGMYKYWQKRKREQNQARFLKLFDEGDGIEDELEPDF